MIVGDALFLFSTKTTIQWLSETLQLDTEAKRNDFATHLKADIDTGVTSAGVQRVHALDITIDEAQRWVAMSKSEREEARAKLISKAEEDAIPAKGIIYEADIPLLQDELAKIKRMREAAAAQGKKGQYRAKIHTERAYREKGDRIIASRDQALYVVLLSEQKGYDALLDSKGYTAEVIDQLKQAIGADAVAYGYQLRDLIGSTGIEAVFEAREGSLFNKVENYYPGKFDQSNKSNEAKNALDMSFGASHQTKRRRGLERLCEGI